MLSARQKKDLIRISVAAVIVIGTSFLDVPKAAHIALYAVAYLVVGYDILLEAWEGLRHGNGLDECVLIVVATLGAWAIAFYDGEGYTEAVAVMLFYQVGEWFQRYAVNKSRRNIASLMDINAEYANVEQVDGSLVQVDPDEVEVGTTIIVKAGEKIPIDGVILSGNSNLDTAASILTVSCVFKRLRLLKIRRLLKSWNLLKKQVPKNPDPNSLLPDLPVFIHRRLSVWQRPWHYYRPCSDSLRRGKVIGISGYTVP